MTTVPAKLAVVVRGGWDGHSPVEATESVHPPPRGKRLRGPDRRLPAPSTPTPRSWRRTDLILQCNTMATIGHDELGA